MWWHDDSQFYAGVLTHSTAHLGGTASYADGEWTFYNLGYEVALLARPPKLLVEWKFIHLCILINLI